MKTGLKFFYTGNMANASTSGTILEVVDVNTVKVEYKNGIIKNIPTCLFVTCTIKNIGNANNFFLESEYKAVRSEQMRKFGN